MAKQPVGTACTRHTSFKFQPCLAAPAGPWQASWTPAVPAAHSVDYMHARPSWPCLMLRLACMARPAVRAVQLLTICTWRCSRRSRGTPREHLRRQRRRLPVASCGRRRHEQGLSSHAFKQPRSGGCATRGICLGIPGNSVPAEQRQQQQRRQPAPHCSQPASPPARQPGPGKASSKTASVHASGISHCEATASSCAFYNHN